MSAAPRDAQNRGRTPEPCDEPGADEFRKSRRHIWWCESYEAQAGIEFARTLLGKPLDITALVMGNNALALGFLRVAQQRGIRVPRRLSVVGFDNVPEGALVWPELTTVAQPMREMGRAACCQLFENIARVTNVRTVEYPMELVARESTSPAPD